MKIIIVHLTIQIKTDMKLVYRPCLGLLFICLAAVSLRAQSAATLFINGNNDHETISKDIYGMFSEDLGHGIYGGFWVGKNSDIPNKDGIRLDLVNAFKKIHIPVLRWPGGCFADTYHWKDGIGPMDKRTASVNEDWGQVPDNNHFGTAEFMELCDMLGSQPYIAGNMGSGTVQEMSQWIEYLNSDIPSAITDLRKENGRDKPWKVPFWGVGNESWGCGGAMTPEYYSDLYRRYANFCRNYPGAPLKRIASGPNGNDTHWMEVLMKNIPHNMMWGISLHYYTIATGNWHDKGSATQFGEQQYFGAMKRALDMKNILNDQETVMNQYDPQKKIALVVDEWGIWTDPEPGTNPAFLYQQNSLRDALIAASTLNIFNNHADRVKMACLAQTVNVLQSLALTKGKQMVLTPTYYVFDMYQVHQDATLLPIKIVSPDYEFEGQSIPAINVSASKDSVGAVHISLVNLDPSRSYTLQTSLSGVIWNQVGGEILTSANFNDYNSFENPDKVKPADFSGARKEGNKLVVNMPPKSVVMLTLK